MRPPPPHVPLDEFLDAVCLLALSHLLEPRIQHVVCSAPDLQQLPALRPRQRLARVLEGERDVTVTQRVVVALVRRQRRVLLRTERKDMTSCGFFL